MKGKYDYSRIFDGWNLEFTDFIEWTGIWFWYRSNSDEMDRYIEGLVERWLLKTLPDAKVTLSFHPDGASLDMPPTRIDCPYHDLRNFMVKQGYTAAKVTRLVTVYAKTHRFLYEIDTRAISDGNDGERGN